MHSISKLGLLFLAIIAGRATQAAEIKTIGYGEVSVWPNYAEIVVETKVVKPRLRDALDESHAIQQKSIELAKLYSKSTDSQIFDIRTITDKETRWNSSLKKDDFLGFSGTQLFTTKLIDLENIPPFIDEILKLPATKIASVRFRHTKEDSLKVSAEIVSVQDAIKKGGLIAKSIHLDSISVKEVSDYIELKKPDQWELIQESRGQEIDVYSKGIGIKNISFSPSVLVFTSRAHVILVAK